MPVRTDWRWVKVAALFLVAAGFEIALGVAVVLFAIPLDKVRLSLGILCFVMASVGWARYRRSPVSAAPSPREYLVYFLLAACYGGVVFGIPHSYFQTFRVSSAAMEPTIVIGDKVLVRKFHLQVRRGDIITFVSPPAAALGLENNDVHKTFLKRVVGMPGDVIMIHDKQVFLNGQLLPEPYTIHSDTMSYQTSVPSSPKNYQSRWKSGAFANLTRHEIGDSFGPVRVPENTFFILGDNRDASFDSRLWGPLPRELVTGRAIRVYSPPSHEKRL